MYEVNLTDCQQYTEQNTKRQKRSLFSVFLCIVELDVTLPSINTEIVAIEIQKSFIFSVVGLLIFELLVSLSTVITCVFLVVPILFGRF
jgi:hypothetical protein